MRSVRRKLRQSSAPIYGTLELTLRCNLNCVHCYQKNLDAIDEMDAGQYLNIIAQLIASGTFVLTLTGGEPLLYHDFLEILRSPLLNDLKVCIITNGTLWDDEHFLALRALPFKEVQVSLYGSTPKVHDSITGSVGSFHKTVEAISQLHDLDIKLRVFSITLDQNCEDMNEIEALCKDLGVSFFCGTLLYRPINGERPAHGVSPDSLKKIVSKFGAGEYIREEEAECSCYFCCEAAHNGFTIDSAGNLFPCHMLRIPCGSLLDMPFEEAWRTSEALVHIRSLNKIERFPEECRKCKLVSSCRRCPALFHLETSDYMLPPQGFCHTVQAASKCSKGGVETNG